MSKYKTLSPSSQRESLQESIERRLLDKSLNRRSIESSLEEPLMSTNKSIIYIKLPKKNHSNLANFRPSLYEASLKRLKQQKSNHSKDTAIPHINPKKKNFEEFQEHVLRQYNIEKALSKKALPHVHTPSQKIQKEKSDLTIFLDEKCVEEEEQPRGGKHREHTMNADKRPFFIELEDSIFGFQNLKEKYLSTKQNSLTNKRKLELAEKHQSRSSLGEEYDEVPKLSPYKSKEIEDHMNRYNHRDLFQTKLTGFKTNLHPVDRSLKLRPSLREDSQVNEADFSNFVKRKKLKSTALYLNRIEPEQRRGKVRAEGGKVRAEGGNGAGMECSPWETDLNAFD